MTTEPNAEVGPNWPEREPRPMASPGPIPPWIEPPGCQDDERDEEAGYGHGV